MTGEWPPCYIVLCDSFESDFDFIVVSCHLCDIFSG